MKLSLPLSRSLSLSFALFRSLTHTHIRTHRNPHTANLPSNAWFCINCLLTKSLWWLAQLAETDSRAANGINEWCSASWLTNLPRNNVFLAGPLRPCVMDGLTGAGSISQAGFPCMFAADSTGRAPTSVTNLAVINHQCGAFSPHTNSQYLHLAQITFTLL